MSDTYFCNFSGLPVDARQLGDQAALPGDADPPPERGPEPARRCWGTSPATPTARSTSSSTCGTCRDTLASCTRSSTGEPYYLGAFLIGAYQEILGDLHNLFGDTNAVHVSIDDDGEYTIDEHIKGNTVREVLAYVQYNGTKLTELLRKDVERAVRAGKLTLAESKKFIQFYEQGLDGYTYLEES